jgi:hypothetical protein
MHVLEVAVASVIYRRWKKGPLGREVCTLLLYLIAYCICTVVIWDITESWFVCVWKETNETSETNMGISRWIGTWLCVWKLYIPQPFVVLWSNDCKQIIQLERSSQVCPFGYLNWFSTEFERIKRNYRH